MNTQAIPLEKKVDIIFDFLFDEKLADKETFFWNNLTEDEISELQSIRANPAKSLSKLSVK